MRRLAVLPLLLAASLAFAQAQPKEQPMAYEPSVGQEGKDVVCPFRVSTLPNGEYPPATGGSAGAGGAIQGSVSRSTGGVSTVCDMMGAPV